MSSLRFLIEQQETGVPVPTINGIVSALRFFFTQVLNRPDLARRLVRITHPRSPDPRGADARSMDTLAAAPRTTAPTTASRGDKRVTRHASHHHQALAPPLRPTPGRAPILVDTRPQARCVGQSSRRLRPTRAAPTSDGSSATLAAGSQLSLSNGETPKTP